jgi:hypothetical protein
MNGADAKSLFFNLQEISRFAQGRDWYFVTDKKSGRLSVMFRVKAVVEVVDAKHFVYGPESNYEEAAR